MVFSHINTTDIKQAYIDSKITTSVAFINVSAKRFVILHRVRKTTQ